PSASESFGSQALKSQSRKNLPMSKLGRSKSKNPSLPKRKSNERLGNLKSGQPRDPPSDGSRSFQKSTASFPRCRWRSRSPTLQLALSSLPTTASTSLATLS